MDEKCSSLKDILLGNRRNYRTLVRKWKACAPSSSKNSKEFREALAADIDDLKEKLDFLLRQLTPNKKEMLVQFGTFRSEVDNILRPLWYVQR